MRLKRGVRTTGVQCALVIAMAVADQVCRENAVEFVITSIVDGVHSAGSLHYIGAAFDMRTRDMTTIVKQRVSDEIRNRLAGDYDVVLESDHIHVEWQPKQPL